MYPFNQEPTSYSIQYCIDYPQIANQEKVNFAERQDAQYGCAGRGTVDKENSNLRTRIWRAKSKTWTKRKSWEVMGCSC